MANNPEKLCLLLCRHYMREAEAVLSSGEFEDVIVRDYPPACSSPHLAPEAVRAILNTNTDQGNDVFLVGGCFFAARRLFPALPESCGVHRLEQCFYLLASKSLIDEHMRAGAYVLSPGWLEEWPAHLAQWGFDRTTARAFFGESVTRLVLLDTGINSRNSETLAEFAAHIDRSFQIVPVGLEYFRLVLTDIIFKWRLEKISSRWEKVSEQLNRTMADQSMSFDLLESLTRMKTESEAIEKIMQLFAMLFAPGQMVYASILNGKMGKVYANPVNLEDSAQLQDWLDNGRKENTWIEAQKGFYLRLTHQDKTLGLLEVKEIAFPEYQREYLNLAVLLARVCGLAIANGRLFQEVRQQAITDSLTSLFNRRHFFSLAKREFAEALRYNRPLAALMLDIDHFKSINDNYGHSAGDRVLIEVAQLCRRELRATDICGRYGGEEFIFLLPETPMDGALQMAERLRQGIADLAIAVEGQTLKVTTSLGIAVCEADCSGIEELIDRSDQALYAAKRNGRNRVVAYDAGISDKAGGLSEG